MQDYPKKKQCIWCGEIALLAYIDSKNGRPVYNCDNCGVMHKPPYNNAKHD